MSANPFLKHRVGVPDSSQFVQFLERRVLADTPRCAWCGTHFYPRASDAWAELSPVDYIDASRSIICGRCEKPFLRDLAIRTAARKAVAA